MMYCGLNEQTYVSIITDLANQLASKSINEAEFKARLTEAQQEKQQLPQRTRNLSLCSGI